MSTPLEPTGGLDLETVENAIELKDVEGLSQGQIVRRRFFRHRGALVGLLTLLLIALLAYTSIGALGISGWWKWNHFTPGDVVNGGRPSLSLPSWLGGNGFAIGDHPFGQDEIGRDIFARAMKGTQTSLNVMVIISLLAALIGMTIGAVSGYFRGGIDQFLMRFTDLFITFPVIVIGAVLGNIAGSAGAFWLAVALGAITWTTLARLVRGEFLTLREREFVDAAKVAGASSFRIIRKHMIPNAMGVIIVNTTLLASQAVLLETALSYLRVRHPVTGRVAGHDDLGVPDGVLDPALAVLVAGPADRDDRAVGQLHRRRPARRLRPAAEAGSLAAADGQGREAPGDRDRDVDDSRGQPRGHPVTGPVVSDDSRSGGERQHQRGHHQDDQGRDQGRCPRSSSGPGVRAGGCRGVRRPAAARAAWPRPARRGCARPGHAVARPAHSPPRPSRVRTP